jgi:SAM-dependent methyltransferase
MEPHDFLTIARERGRRVAQYRMMVVGYYDHVTEGYRERWGDSFHLPVFSGSMSMDEGIASIEQRVAAEGGFGADSHVLDVGCGVGGPTLRLARLTGAHMVGVNIVPRQIEIARIRASDEGLGAMVRFDHGDGMHLPYLDRCFDGVVVFESGCHMPDKSGFYQECARVLKRGGRFLGVDWMRAANLSRADYARYIDPICVLHGIPDLIGVDEFASALGVSGLALESVEDLTERTGLSQLSLPSIDDWTPVWAHGVPPVQDLLSLGGAALALGAQSGAFKLCYWTSHRL